MTPSEIIKAAVDQYKPLKCIMLVSGGHDSVTAAHVSSKIVSEMGISFEIYHGDTTIGIPDTQSYVKSLCKLYGWKLSIRKPNDENHSYRNLVLKYGFPGPTKIAHQMMFRYLKERALNRFISYECKSSPLKRENILLITGIRRDESQIRMGYTNPVTKDRSKIWCSPIFNWTEEECRTYMYDHGIPRNPVKDKMCISGECLCGCFAKPEEFAELKYYYPEVAKVITDLHEEATAAGKPWPWGKGPVEWKKEELKKSQTSLNFMCIGCELSKKII